MQVNIIKLTKNIELAFVKRKGKRNKFNNTSDFLTQCMKLAVSLLADIIILFKASKWS